MPVSPRARAWLLIVAAAIAGLLAATRLRVVTDIRHFIPSGLDSGLSTISAQLAASPLTRTSILALRGPDPASTGPAFNSCLLESPLVEWSRSGIDEQTEQATHELYFPRRFYLPAPEAAELDESAARLKQTLGGPQGSLIRPLAPKDPLLLFPDFLKGLRDTQQLRVERGQFVTADGSAAILFVRTGDSAFNGAAQRGFQDLLTTCAERSGDGLELLQSGIGRFALAAETRTKADVTRVSVASTVAIIATFLLLFGRVRTIILAFAPAVAGFAFGLAGTAIVTPELHGISLAFGSALLGVGVDYAIHLMFHLDHRGDRSVTDVVRRVRPGLVLGALTTAVGLGGMALTSFPGMRELALLGTIGIAGSLTATLLLVPAFVGTLPKRRIRDRWVAYSHALLGWVEQRGHIMGVVLGATVLAGAVGTATLEWSDGLRALYQADEGMLAEDAEVRELTGAAPLSRMVLARGPSLESALARNDEVHAVLEAATAQGELEGFRSLHPWLPSVAAQSSNLERLRSDAFQQRMREAYRAEGFVDQAFRPFFDELQAPAKPLLLEDFESTPFEQILSPFVLRATDGGEDVVVVTWLRGEVSEALAERLSELNDVQLFDQQTFLDSAYGRYRAEMIRMMALGLGAVALVILLWYRSWRVAAAAFFPALAGACGALATAAWVDTSANLIHAASLLLVCSIGADYGVFMVESRGDRQERAITLASSAASALTTMLSFGLLAMSDNPALASVGRSVVVGVACALLSSPVVVILNRSRSR
ncbi:MAG: MMPL family transporter [Nannocystales bacterium]